MFSTDDLATCIDNTMPRMSETDRRARRRRRTASRSVYAEIERHHLSIGFDIDAEVTAELEEEELDMTAERTRLPALTTPIENNEEGKDFNSNNERHHLSFGFDIDAEIAAELEEEELAATAETKRLTALHLTGGLDGLMTGTKGKESDDHLRMLYHSKMVQEPKDKSRTLQDTRAALVA